MLALAVPKVQAKSRSIRQRRQARAGSQRSGNAAATVVATLGPFQINLKLRSGLTEGGHNFNYCSQLIERYRLSLSRDQLSA